MGKIAVFYSMTLKLPVLITSFSLSPLSIIIKGDRFHCDCIHNKRGNLLNGKDERNYCNPHSRSIQSAARFLRGKRFIANKSASIPPRNSIMTQYRRRIF